MIIWDVVPKELHVILEFLFQRIVMFIIQIPEQFGPVRMLSQGRGNMVIVGTTRNCILQGSLHLKFTPIVQGHMDELWGLASHPNQHQFVTCSYDRLLYLWDTLTHSAIWTLDLPVSMLYHEFHETCHSVTFIVLVNSHQR